MFFGRSKTNPARAIRGKLSETPRGRKEGHYAAPFEEVPAFFQLLRRQHGSAGRALEVRVVDRGALGGSAGAIWEEIHK